MSWEGLEQHRSAFTTWWFELIKAGSDPRLEEKIELTAYILWQTWKARNGRIFQQVEYDPREIECKVVSEWREFQQAQNLKNLEVVNDCLRLKQEASLEQTRSRMGEDQSKLSNWEKYAKRCYWNNCNE